MDEFEKAQETWEQMRATKYSDERIKSYIDGITDDSSALGYSLYAMAMIAYNNMIDARIEKAERSWVVWGGVHKE